MAKEEIDKKIMRWVTFGLGVMLVVSVFLYFLTHDFNQPVISLAHGPGQSNIAFPVIALITGLVLILTAPYDLKEIIASSISRIFKEITALKDKILNFLFHRKDHK
jgi:hypothetical protein